MSDASDFVGVSDLRRERDELRAALEDLVARNERFEADKIDTSAARELLDRIGP